jgi:N-acyl-D-amino-acid deacylase
LNSSTLIKDCWITDGNGSPLSKKMVLIGDGKVVALEDHITESAAEHVFRCNGAIAAPGFIDAHGHSDLSALAKPECFSKISQGVSSEIIGNCGLSAFPITEYNRAHLTKLYANYGVELSWCDYTTYQAELKRRNVRLKLHALCGHNTLRGAVAGYEQKELDPAQIDEMGRLFDLMLAQGAIGLSTGLLYVPGKFADDDEIIFLMKHLAAAGKLYATHLRSEGSRLLEAIDETLRCARKAKLQNVQFSHFKTAGKDNWHKLEEALAMIEEARSAGMELTLDRYPYTRSMTQLSTVLPGEWEELPDVTIKQKLTDTKTAEAVEQLLSACKRSWDDVLLVQTASPCGKMYLGKSISEIARLNRLAPEALVISLLRDDSPGTTAAFSGMSSENLQKIISRPYTCCGSDENARPADYSIGRSHPRGFGSLPRFLKMCLESGASIPDAVRQVTGLPAHIFRLEDAGILSVGKSADIVIFDPDELDGCDDFVQPHTPASGIRQLFINGREQL